MDTVSGRDLKQRGLEEKKQEQHGRDTAQKQTPERCTAGRKRHGNTKVSGGSITTH